jgi:ADP-L-glycero-D-manno-heptose 6-epimerase
MKKVLITGGSGFIGSNIAAELAANCHYNVNISDWLGHKNKWRNLSKHEISDIADPAHILHWLEENGGNLQAIIHMGAISSTTEHDSDLIIQNNFRFSLELFNWCAANNVPFIYASSAATYGRGENGFKGDYSLEYLQSLRPLNPYGWSKALFDMKVARIAQQKGKMPPQWVGLKFFNVYGPNEYHKGSQSSVIYQMYPRARQGIALKLFKSYNPNYTHGQQLRDFIYVKDCAKVIEWFLQNPSKSGIFNVGTGIARSFYDLADNLCKSVGKPTRVDFVEMPQDLVDKYQYETQADLTNLRQIGYKGEFTSLEDGITDYVENYLSKDDIYR